MSVYPAGNRALQACRGVDDGVLRAGAGVEEPQFVDPVIEDIEAYQRDQRAPARFTIGSTRRMRAATAELANAAATASVPTISAKPAA